MDVEDPFVEGGEGVVVLGHGLACDWTDMTRAGDALVGGGLVGRKGWRLSRSVG